MPLLFALLGLGPFAVAGRVDLPFDGGQFEPPALFDHVKHMVNLGKYDNHLLEDYTEEEFKNHTASAAAVLAISARRFF